MFILRTILPDTTQTNSMLGDKYDVIERDTNYDLFGELFSDYFHKNHVADLDDASNEKTKLCYGFVGKAPNYIPIWKNRKNFIMTENGKTFANISDK